MSDFSDTLGQIGNVIGWIGGQGLNLLNMVATIEHGGLPNYLANRAQLAQDPGSRALLEQSPFYAGMAGYGMPGQVPNPTDIRSGYSNTGDIIRGIQGNPSLPPLLPPAGTMTPEQAQQYAKTVGVGTPGGPRQVSIKTPFGAETFGGGPAGRLRLEDPAHQVETIKGVDWAKMPDGTFEYVGAPRTDKGSEVESAGTLVQPDQPATTQASAGGPVLGVIGSPTDRLVGNEPPPVIGSPGPWGEGFVTPAAARDNTQILDAMGAPSAPTPAQPASPQAQPSQYRPGTRVLQTPTGPVYSAPTGFSATGKPEMKVYDPRATGTGKIPTSVYDAWAAGTDPTRGGIPASPAQVAAGKAFVQQKVQTRGQLARATASNRPATQSTQDTLTNIASVNETAKYLLTQLQNPDVTRWLGPGKGQLAWTLYKAGLSPNEAISHFETLGELFKIESAGRLARLAGSRTRQVWEELTTHPPHPWDTPSLIQSKLNDIMYVTRHIAEVQTKIAGMGAGKLQSFMRREMAQPAAGPEGAPAAAPQAAPAAAPAATPTQGVEVPGVPGAMYLGRQG